MRKPLLLFVLSLGVITGVKAQQDPQLSQYMFNNISINPAYAGYKEQLYLQGFYRAQWVGLDGAPRTMGFTADASANDGNVGLALQIANDKIGPLNTFSTYANYAYRLRVSQTGARLALGLGVGFAQIRINGDELKPIEDDDQNIPKDRQSVITPDIRAGIFFSNNRYFAGFSVDNLLPKYMDFSSDPNYLIPVPRTHYYLTGGALFPLGEDYQIKPTFLVKTTEGAKTTIDLNSFILMYDKVWLGASYRMDLFNKTESSKQQRSNAVVLMTEIFAVPNLRVGYSYDFDLNSLSRNHSGSHEISLGYYFNSGESKMLSPRHF